jgi:FAD/FMN-containing dehydrogenase
MNAFEIMNRLSLELVIAHIPGTREPLDHGSDWYVLLENADRDLDGFLATQLERGTIMDAVVAQNDAQRASLWKIRHSISEAQKLDGAGIKHDISVPISEVANFIDRGSALVTSLVPGCRVVAFGHLGDGNIHFNLNQPPDMSPDAFVDQWSMVSREVHALAVDLGGSFSAEHGIGELKRALDPAGIMNPGKILRDPEA